MGYLRILPKLITGKYQTQIDRHSSNYLTITIQKKMTKKVDINRSSSIFFWHPKRSPGILHFGGLKAPFLTLTAFLLCILVPG